MPVQNSNSNISARPDLATNLLQILILALHLKAYCVKKANLHFSYVLKGGLLGRYLVVNPKKSKLKILYRNLPVQKGVFFFRNLPVQKTKKRVTG